MKLGKRRITATGLLRLINDVGDTLLPPDKKSTYRRAMGYEMSILPLENYFPSVVGQAVDNLLRQGLVKKIKTSQGTIIKISDKGKTQILKFKLEEFKPKAGKWDGKWRVVFFDIPRLQNSKRNWLRKYLKKLGLQKMQESVFVGPFDVSSEIKYLREILDVPHGVKMGVLSEIENEEELKDYFDL